MNIIMSVATKEEVTATAVNIAKGGPKFPNF
jgi:hypothetical protein